MATEADTFVEASSDTTLASHTPTGANAGTSWSLVIASGSISVIASSDRAEDISSSNGNRYRMDDDLTSDQHDVQGDFTRIADAANTFWGPTGRNTSSGTGTVGVEFNWERENGGRYTLSDATASDTLTETWTVGDTKTMLLQIRNNDMRGYAAGVEKVSIVSNGKSGNTRGGMMLGNFGGTANRMACDNYTSVDAPTTRRLLTLGIGSLVPLWPAWWRWQRMRRQ